MMQGDVVSATTFEILDLSESGNPTRITKSVEGWVILTQSCDLARHDRPFVIVCPIVLLPDPKASSANRGREPRYVSLVGYRTNCFADLDECMTVSKALIQRLKVAPGLESDDDRRKFGLCVARKFTRTAFPDDLAPTLKKLVERVKEKEPKQGFEGQTLAGLDDIRVELLDEDSKLIANLIFLVDEELAPDQAFVGKPGAPSDVAEKLYNETGLGERTILWDEFVQALVCLCIPFGNIVEVTGEVVSSDEFSYRRMRASDPLDLDYLSYTPASTAR